MTNTSAPRNVLLDLKMRFAVCEALNHRGAEVERLEIRRLLPPSAGLAVPLKTLKSVKRERTGFGCGHGEISGVAHAVARAFHPSVCGIETEFTKRTGSSLAGEEGRSAALRAIKPKSGENSK